MRGGGGNDTGRTACTGGTQLAVAIHAFPGNGTCHLHQTTSRAGPGWYPLACHSGSACPLQQACMGLLLPCMQLPLAVCHTLINVHCMQLNRHAQHAIHPVLRSGGVTHRIARSCSWSPARRCASGSQQHPGPPPACSGFPGDWSGSCSTAARTAAAHSVVADSVRAGGACCCDDAAAADERQPLTLNCVLSSVLARLVAMPSPAKAAAERHTNGMPAWVQALSGPSGRPRHAVHLQARPFAFGRVPQPTCLDRAPQQPENRKNLAAGHVRQLLVPTCGVTAAPRKVGSGGGGAEGARGTMLQLRLCGSVGGLAIVWVLLGEEVSRQGILMLCASL